MLKSNNRLNKKKDRYIYPVVKLLQSSTNRVYLDYAAGVSANPSSIHSAGLDAKIKLQNSRKEVSDILGARPEEIIFTSGGTESNNLAIQGAVFAWHEYKKEGMPGDIMPHIVTTNIEHPSVLETCRLLAKRKLATITTVPVEADGIVDVRKIKKEIKKNTILVSVMYANNEIGIIQPIKEIAKEIRHYKKNYPYQASLEIRGKGKEGIYPLFHTDAVQAVNYLDLNAEKLGVDLLSLSGSKIEGAASKDGQAGRVGVLYKKKAVELANVFGGGEQEMGLRPGTENLPEILKFSAALKLTQNIRGKEAERLTKLRGHFIKQLQKMSKTVFDNKLMINGDLENRLPNNINVTFQNIPSDLLVIELSAKGIMASSKSACKSSKAEGSYVIQALRNKIDLPSFTKASEGGVRFSLGRQTTKSDIDYTVKVLSKILTKLKKWYN